MEIDHIVPRFCPGYGGKQGLGLFSEAKFRPIGKKGIFFTMLAVTLVSLMLLMYLGSPSRGQTREIASAGSMLSVTEDVAENVKNAYLPKLFEIQSTLAIQAMLNHTDAADTPFSGIVEVNSVYSELMGEGTIGGLPQGGLTGIFNKTDELSDSLWDNFMINSTILLSNFNITQADPWYITVSTDANISVKKSTVEYSFIERYSLNISVIGLRDPLFLVANMDDDFGKRVIQPRLKMTNWRATTPALGIDSLTDMINNKTYTNTSISPSFLMRLGGDYNASLCCGIESLVTDTIPLNIKSYVDYMYLTEGNKTLCGGGATIYNYTEDISLPEGYHFKLDGGHDGLYNVTDYHSPDSNLCDIY